MKKNQCLGCHRKLEDKYIFCSFTCACLCGYFSVTKGWIKKPSEITDEEKEKFLNNDPLRVRDRGHL